METGPQYKVLTGETVFEIERNINEAFVSGWVPQGGISAGYNPDAKTHSFFQAVVKVQMEMPVS